MFCFQLLVEYIDLIFVLMDIWCVVFDVLIVCVFGDILDIVWYLVDVYQSSFLLVDWIVVLLGVECLIDCLMFISVGWLFNYCMSCEEVYQISFCLFEYVW